jgi:hypothetical protein
LFERSNGFPKDGDVFAHVVSSRNTSSGQRLFASSSKQVEVSKIKRQNPTNSNIPIGGQQFQLESREIKRQQQDKVFFLCRYASLEI